MQRRYIWLSAVFIVIVLVGILALYVSFQVRGDNIEYCEDACSSKECLDTVYSIARNMDKDIEPCQDFYSFTCGNWIRKQNRTRSMKEEMSRALIISIKDMLEEINESETYVTAKKLKAVYDTCTNKTTAETSAIPSILEFFQKLGLGDWPNLSKDFKFQSPPLEEVIATLIEYDMFPFINVGASNKTNEKNFHHFIVSGKKHFETDRMKDVLLQILRYFRVRTQSVDNVISDFMSVSREIQSFLPQEYCIENCEYQSVDVLCSPVPNRHLKFICDIASYLIEHNGLERNISTDHLVLLNASPVLVLYDLQTDYTHRTLANYLALSFITKSTPHLYFFLRKLQFDFLRDELDETVLPAENWEFCTFWMQIAMPELLGELYSMKMMPTSKSLDVADIFAYSKEETANLILEQHWMQKKEKMDLIESMKTMKFTLLSQSLHLSGKTYSLLREFETSNSSFLWNALGYQRQNFVFHLFRTLSDEDKRIPKIFRLGAQFSPGYTDVFFGSLLPPVYDYSRPGWLNVIPMSSIIGHEIGHAIIHYIETNEISNQTSEKIKSKAICLEEQYSKFHLYGSEERVNGTITFKENLADLISIEVTERVMNKVMKEHKGEEYICLSDVPLSTRQVFYMLLTQLWCETERSEINDDVEHTVARFRITGAMQNAKEFSDVFQCSRSSYMNPEHKCSFFE